MQVAATCRQRSCDAEEILTVTEAESMSEGGQPGGESCTLIG